MSGIIIGSICIALGIALWIIQDWLYERYVSSKNNEEEDI